MVALMNNPEVMDLLIGAGAMLACLLGLYVMVSLALGAPVPAPARRKR